VQGLRAEERVIQYLQNKNLRILKTRWRTTYAEIDILAESARQEIWIFEVKSLSHFDFLDVRVSRRQKERLKRAFLFVQGQMKKPVRIALAFVDKAGEVLIIENF
jgi:Holliday junction resolvase-like predicted endonuclease